MEQYLRKAGVMWKDFKQFAIGLRAAFVNRGGYSKEATAPSDLFGVEPSEQGGRGAPDPTP
jgi:hypothetical protein